jgi:hypothetical protein
VEELDNSGPSSETFFNFYGAIEKLLYVTPPLSTYSPLLICD